MKRLVINNGTVLLPKEELLEKASIVIENNKIVGIEKNYSLNNIDEIIDAEGLFVAPGFIDPHVHVGVWGEALGPPGFDGNEMTNPVTPFLRSIDSIYHDDIGFEDAVRGGVTTIGVTMGSSNVIGGEAAALKTKPGNMLDKLIKEPVALKMALGENPKRFYGSDKKIPSTRMGNAYLIRKAFVDAQNYMAKWAAYEQDDEKDKKAPPDRDLGMEAVSRVLRKEIPAKIHCHRADDIVSAVRIAEEFDINYTLDHCTEGHLISDFLAEKDAICIVGPVLMGRTKVEVKNLDPKTIGVLYNAGVSVTMTTDHPFVPIHHFLKQVEEAVEYGLPLEAALDVITINAAKALGLEGQVGALKTGYDADVVLLTTPPGVPGCKVVKTIIDGELIWER